METERSEYVVQTRHAQGTHWADLHNYPVGDGSNKHIAIARADAIHGNPPHLQARVVRRLTSEWVIHTSD